MNSCVLCFREREEEEALELARKTQQEELSRQRAADQEKQDAQKARDRMREQDRRRRMAVSAVGNRLFFSSINWLTWLTIGYFRVGSKLVLVSQ